MARLRIECPQCRRTYYEERENLEELTLSPTKCPHCDKVFRIPPPGDNTQKGIDSKTAPYQDTHPRPGGIAKSRGGTEQLKRRRP